MMIGGVAATMTMMVTPKKAVLFVLAVLILLFGPVVSQVESEKQQGTEFAEEFLWPILALFSFKKSIDIGSPAELLNFFAAFILIYFLMSNILSSGGVGAVITSLLIVSYLELVLVLDWYVFFIDVAPAIVAYFLAYDMVSMMATVTERNVKLISLFVFGVTYFMKPTRAIFDSFFRSTFSYMTWGAGVAFVILIAILRMASVVISAMHTSTALQARYSMRQAREALLDRMLFDKYK